jgi:hypothetical protein
LVITVLGNPYLGELFATVSSASVDGPSTSVALRYAPLVFGIDRNSRSLNVAESDDAFTASCVADAG